MKSKNRENSFRFARKSPVNAKSNADVMVAAYDVNSSTRDQDPIDEQPVGHGRRASTQYLNASVLRPTNEFT